MVVADILQQIVAYKYEFIAASKRKRSASDLKARLADMPLPADFAAALKRPADGELRVIAEVKKASPSKGVIRENFDPLAIAEDYAEHGAAAVSVLTDEQYFQGHLDYLRQIHTALPALPLLRKDFVVDEYQIYEAREAGASAILLICSILDGAQLKGFREIANGLGMDALTEVHEESEAEIAVDSGAKILGVNNRDLRTFAVDLNQTERVMRSLGSARSALTFVSESGISTPADVAAVRRIGADAILVGESFMRCESPGEALSALMAIHDDK
jgi:indole-3-glycerol phosphate synthase